MGLFGAICGAVVSACSKIGALAVGINALKVVCNVIVNICKALGIIKDDVNEDELAEKSLQAEEQGITPEKFDTYEEYLKEIEKFEIDPDKKHTEKEILEKKLEISSSLLTEKYGEDVLDLLIEIPKYPDFLTTERIIKYLVACEDGKLDFLDIKDILDNSIKSIDKKDSIMSSMIEVEKELNPHLSDDEAKRNIIMAKN